MIPKRSVAVSILPAHVATSRTRLVSLQREFDEIRALHHPNIARVLELHCDAQQCYVTSERLDGEPLREVLTHLSPERLDAEEADDIVRAIGSALIHAHDQGVVHGDVRPENVLVTMDRRFLLTNFLSRRVAPVAGPVRRVDDSVGLAKLAAELYTGSASPRALRAAAHDGVSAARLKAIRTVLETPARRQSGNIEEFLAAAGLSPAGARAHVRRSPPHRRLSSLLRRALGVAALVGISAFIASYYNLGEWRESVTELRQRSAEVIRDVTTEPTSSSGAATDAEPAGVEVTADQDVESAAVDSPVAGESADAAPSPPEVIVERTPEPAPEIAQTPEPVPEIPQTTDPGSADPVAAAAAERGEPSVLSMAVPRISVREDHTVVVIDIVRIGDTTRETPVGWWIAPETAEPDEDYVTGGKQLVSFPRGSSMQRVLIPIVDDGVREPQEVFTVHLGLPRDAVAGDATATRVTVFDDD